MYSSSVLVYRPFNLHSQHILSFHYDLPAINNAVLLYSDSAKEAG